MTTIKATCPVCGDVDLTPPQVRLVVCSVAAWSYYAFDCPGCRDEVRKPADAAVVRLLRSGGVAEQTWHVPAEALEAKAGPPLTYDDLLDAALWLAGHTRLVGQLTGLTGAAGRPTSAAG